MDMTSDELSKRLWRLAARIGKVVDALPETRLGRHVAGQLVRCGTSAAPNYDEGCNAESRADFIHKLSIALKEQRETLGWLRFIPIAGLLPDTKLTDVIDECLQLCRVLGSSIGTAKGCRSSSSDSGPLVLHDAPVSEISNSQFSIPNSQSPFLSLDHLAIVVPDTDDALTIWRDRVGLKLLYSEVVNQGAVRLTHLDLGNTQLQLVEPLTPDHPLRAWLEKNGPGLHHFCFKVEDVREAYERLPEAGLPVAANIHQGTQGKRALFLDKNATQGVQVEITGR
jgi:methylmalonyl-CoA/ethylmalonyl-CoA epimerase